MKKLFLSLVAAMVAATTMYAQSSQIATLSHENNITTFYGVSALRDAYNASQDGDVITLSSGSFTSVDINKALTIRGAGMTTGSNAVATVLSGDFMINIPTTTSHSLKLEGLYNNNHIYVNGTISNAQFLKCSFKYFYYNQGGKLSNAMFVHCKIMGSIHLPSESSASCVNCFIDDPQCASETNSNFEFSNCFIISDNLQRIKSSILKNCILYNSSSYSEYYGNNENYYLPSSVGAYHCLGIEYTRKGYMFSNVVNGGNKYYTGEWSDLFVKYKGESPYSLSDTMTFKLTDEAKTKYLGDDGTEVGMYGGNFPFDPTTSNPQITKCQVASKSTADGKLSVDIEVKAGE